MEVQQLRHLLAAVQYGNLVKAADECCISQSGLSRSIKSLETRLGVPLLIRRTNGVEPTVYGLSILDRARVILSEVRKSVEQIKEVRSGRHGHVTVGVTHNFAHEMLPSVISTFAGEEWDMQINAVVGSFPDLVEKVRAGDVDFAFGLLSTLENRGSLRIEEVCDSQARVVARAAHPLVRVRNVSLDHLAQARWAMLDSESIQRRFTAYFQTRGQAEPMQVLKTNSAVLLKRMIKDIDALTVLPPDMLREELESGELVLLEAEAPAGHARAGFILREDGYVPPAMARLMDAIRRRAAQDREAETLTFMPAMERPRSPIYAT